MSFRPMRDMMLCVQLEPERKSSGGIELLGMLGPFSRMTVVSKGPEVTDDIDVGDTVWVHGYKSGIKVEDDLFLVSDKICEIVEKEEKE